MRLLDLNPRFVRYYEKVETYEVIDGPEETWRERGFPTKMKTGPRECQPYADTLVEAQGIVFVCPACVNTNGHRINVTFKGRDVPEHLGTHGSDGKPSRWEVTGTTFEDLTLSPSVDVGCWHGYVTNGEVK